MAPPSAPPARLVRCPACLARLASPSPRPPRPPRLPRPLPCLPRPLHPPPGRLATRSSRLQLGELSVLVGSSTYQSRDQLTEIPESGTSRVRDRPGIPVRSDGVSPTGREKLEGVLHCLAQDSIADISIGAERESQCFGRRRRGGQVCTERKTTDWCVGIGISAPPPVGTKTK